MFIALFTLKGANGALDGIRQIVPVPLRSPHSWSEWHHRTRREALLAAHTEHLTPLCHRDSHGCQHKTSSRIIPR